jgi:hypothetical protein
LQCGKSAKRSHIEALLEPASLNLVEKIGDWFLLQLIVKNLDTLTVNDVILLLYMDQEGIKPKESKESKESNVDTEKVKPPSETA